VAGTFHLEAAGVGTDENGGGSGVRLRKRQGKRSDEGRDGFKHVDEPVARLILWSNFHAADSCGRNTMARSEATRPYGRGLVARGGVAACNT
jgi:hypothetical protein